MDAFVEAALEDAEDQLSLFQIGSVPSAYIGGGTPSALGAGRIGRLLSGLGRLFAGLRSPPSEITVEANPESAGADFLRACASGGATRISLGAQTFSAKSRGAIGRAGSPALLERRLALAARHFPGAFSADLIAGLPFQTHGILAGDIERLLAHGPAHASLYSLTLEPETPLGRKALGGGAGAIGLPDRDEADGLWIAGHQMLESAGLAQYEVSSFALPGKACAHNIRYWNMESWIGIGPAASSTLIFEGEGEAPAFGERPSLREATPAQASPPAARRFAYPGDVAAYLSAPRPRLAIAQAEALSRSDLMRESLLMGFRLRSGPDEQIFRRRFGMGIADCIPGAVARWRERGFFAEGMAPSAKGLLFAGAFLRDAFAELDSAASGGPGA